MNKKEISPLLIAHLLGIALIASILTCYWITTYSPLAKEPPTYEFIIENPPLQTPITAVVLRRTDGRSYEIYLYWYNETKGYFTIWQVVP